MTDLALRQLQRQGPSPALLAARLRAGLLVPAYTSVREVACSCRDFTGWSFPAVTGYCPDDICDGTRTLAYEPWDLLRLMAYLGDEHARELDVRTCGPGFPDGGCCNEVRDDCWYHIDQWPLDTYLTGLARLAAKLPPVRVEVPCPDCDNSGCRYHRGAWDECVVVGPTGPNCSPCPDCNGTGKTHHDTSADRYLLVIAAHAVAREVGEAIPLPSCRSSATRCGGCWFCALNACAAWIARPGPKPVFLGTYAPGHAWYAMAMHEPERALRAASKLLTPQRVREVAASALLEALRV